MPIPPTAEELALLTPTERASFHPEGGRSKGDDPHELLSAQPGVGQVVLGAPRAKVFRVFLHGVTNDIFKELADNWTRPDERPIDICFGPQLRFDDLRARGDRLAIQKAASDRCLEGIHALAEAHRVLHGGARRDRRDAAAEAGGPS